MQQYIVKPSDTLFLIAKEFDVPLAQLIKANPQITNPNLIYEGQTILIPNLPEIPDQIGIIETNALNIIDDIVMADWQSAYGRIGNIRTAMNNVTPILQEAEVPNHVISGLNTAIRALEQNILQRKTFSAISQANRITQLIADALDYFNVIIPTDLRRLAFFARQIIVNVEQNDWEEARENHKRAMIVWQRIRPELADGYVSDVSNFEQVMNDLEASMDRMDYQGAINNAARMLELIDVLAYDFEQLYT